MFKEAHSSEMEPILPRGTWNTSWEITSIEGQKVSEQLLQALRDLYFQYSFTPQGLCILVSSISSSVPICDFKGRSKEITDNKIFHSDQTPPPYFQWRTVESRPPNSVC